MRPDQRPPESPDDNNKRNKFVLKPKFILRTDLLSAHEGAVLEALLHVCVSDGLHKINNRQIAAIARVSASKTNGILIKFEKLGYIKLEKGYLRDKASGDAKGHHQIFIRVCFDKIWQDNEEYFQVSHRFIAPDAFLIQADDFIPLEGQPQTTVHDKNNTVHHKNSSTHDMNNSVHTENNIVHEESNTVLETSSTPQGYIIDTKDTSDTNRNKIDISVPAIKIDEAPTSPLRTHLSEQNEIFVSHPIHEFILFDDLAYPTQAIAFGLIEPRVVDVREKTQMENDKRKRIVEDVVRRLSAKGFPISIEKVVWKYRQAEDENVVEGSLISHSHDIPETTLSSQENGGVGDQERKYAAGYAGVGEQKEPEQAKAAKETPERKAAREIVEYTEANRYVAGRRGGPFTREARGKGKSGASQWDKNLEAALKIVKAKITPEQYFRAYDSQNNDWWNEKNGSLTCVEMAANTKRGEMRAVELWEKVSSRSESIVQSAQSPVTNSPASGELFSEADAQRIMEAVKARSTADLTFESRVADRENGYVVNIRVTSRFYGAPKGRSGFTNEAEVWELVERHEKAVQEELLKERQKQGMEAQQWQRASYNGLQA